MRSRPLAPVSGGEEARGSIRKLPFYGRREPMEERHGGYDGCHR